jgi:cell division protein FtsB
VSRRLALVAAAGLVVAGLAVGGNSVLRILAMKRELSTLERDLGELRARADKLAHVVERLRNDPAYIEQLAREDLGYVRQGETVLKFPSPPK